MTAPTFPTIGLPPSSEAVSLGIRVETESIYVRERSHPEAGRYFFAYHIHIVNHSSQTVQLLSRRWVIADSTGREEVVEGDGVVGNQPVLAPGEAFEYESFCPLPTPTGTMRGWYVMATPDGVRFQATIAPFALIAPMTIN